MNTLPQSMFKEIDPHLSFIERLREFLKSENYELQDAHDRTQAASVAYGQAVNRRDGTAPGRLKRLKVCVTDQMRAENQSGGAK